MLSRFITKRKCVMMRSKISNTATIISIVSIYFPYNVMISTESVSKKEPFFCMVNQKCVHRTVISMCKQLVNILKEDTIIAIKKLAICRIFSQYADKKQMKS